MNKVGFLFKLIFFLIVILLIVGMIGGYFIFKKLNYFSEEKKCGSMGEQFSKVYIDEYPESCCDGLTEWDSGFDTRISVGDNCYETMMVGGNPVGTCINCGNGICENIEDVCNCPEDCTSENSEYVTVIDFCDSYVGVNTGITIMCEEDAFDLPLCELCDW